MGLALTVEQFHELADKLKNAGVNFIIEPHLRFEGMPGEQYTMFFKDPSGENIMLILSLSKRTSVLIEAHIFFANRKQLGVQSNDPPRKPVCKVQCRGGLAKKQFGHSSTTEITKSV